jgi:hypothetical protein
MTPKSACRIPPISPGDKPAGAVGDGEGAAWDACVAVCAAEVRPVVGLGADVGAVVGAAIAVGEVGEAATADAGLCATAGEGAGDGAASDDVETLAAWLVVGVPKSAGLGIPPATAAPPTPGA